MDGCEAHRKEGLGRDREAGERKMNRPEVEKKDEKEKGGEWEASKHD